MSARHGRHNTHSGALERTNDAVLGEADASRARLEAVVLDGPPSRPAGALEPTVLAAAAARLARRSDPSAARAFSREVSSEPERGEDRFHFERARQAQDRGVVPYHLLGSAEESAHDIAKRRALLAAPAVLSTLLRFWTTAGLAYGACMHETTYVDIYERVGRALGVLDPHAPRSASRGLILADWRSDMGAHDEKKGMPLEAFCAGLFELADVWTEGTAEHEYVSFLSKLFRRVTRPAAPGAALRAGLLTPPPPPPAAPVGSPRGPSGPVADPSTAFARRRLELAKSLAHAPRSYAPVGDVRAEGADGAAGAAGAEGEGEGALGDGRVTSLQLPLAGVGSGLRTPSPLPSPRALGPASPRGTGLVSPRGAATARSRSSSIASDIRAALDRLGIGAPGAPAAEAPAADDASTGASSSSDDEMPLLWLRPPDAPKSGARDDAHAHEREVREWAAEAESDLAKLIAGVRGYLRRHDAGGGADEPAHAPAAEPRAPPGAGGAGGGGGGGGAADANAQVELLTAALSAALERGADETSDVIASGADALLEAIVHEAHVAHEARAAAAPEGPGASPGGSAAAAEGEHGAKLHVVLLQLGADAGALSARAARSLRPRRREARRSSQARGSQGSSLRPRRVTMPPGGGRHAGGEDARSASFGPQRASGPAAHASAGAARQRTPPRRPGTRPPAHAHEHAASFSVASSAGSGAAGRAARPPSPAACVSVSPIAARPGRLSDHGGGSMRAARALPPRPARLSDHGADVGGSSFGRGGGGAAPPREPSPSSGFGGAARRPGLSPPGTAGCVNRFAGGAADRLRSLTAGADAPPPRPSTVSVAFAAGTGGGALADEDADAAIDAAARRAAAKWHRASSPSLDRDESARVTHAAGSSARVARRSAPAGSAVWAHVADAYEPAHAAAGGDTRDAAAAHPHASREPPLPRQPSADAHAPGTPQAAPQRPRTSGAAADDRQLQGAASFSARASPPRSPPPAASAHRCARAAPPLSPPPAASAHRGARVAPPLSPPARTRTPAARMRSAGLASLHQQANPELVELPADFALRGRTAAQPPDGGFARGPPHRALTRASTLGATGEMARAASHAHERARSPGAAEHRPWTPPLDAFHSPTDDGAARRPPSPSWHSLVGSQPVEPDAPLPPLHVARSSLVRRRTTELPIRTGAVPPP